MSTDEKRIDIDNASGPRQRDDRVAPRYGQAGENTELSAVIRIINAIGSQTDLEDILSTITVEMSRILDFDIGCVAVYDKDKNCLFLRHVYRKNGDKRGEGRYVPLDESNLVGWVAINRTPVLRSNIPADQRFSEIMKEDLLKSDIVVPLITKNALIGTVNFGSFKEDNYSLTDLDLLIRFSELTSIAIEKAALLQDLKGLGEKYQILMKTADDLIMLLDISGVIIECNDAVKKIFGYSKNEVIGRVPSDFAVPERREAVVQNFGKVMRGEITKAVEIPYLRKNGETVYLDFNFSVIGIKSHPYLLVVGHDVTDRKMLEDRITIQNRELTESNRKLMELDQLKSEFLGRISHELRTPLSVIMAYTDTLLNDSALPVDHETSKEFLEIIDMQSKDLLKLINDLLDLSKLEVSETMLDITESCINEVTSAAVTITKPFAVQKNVRIIIDLDDSIPIMRFDPLRVKQVVVNLINNAIKFTPGGKNVLISTSRAEADAIVTVCDDGPGIDMKNAASIFDNFTQVDGSSSRSSNGLGIGLRLVKHYIELHKGNVWVESEKDKGATFYFSLPLTANFQPEKTKIAIR
ncbi:MAG: PAS domain S-box protein [Candidatus Krumholzibacteriota bacterium]|nr:PAS domain S-box protein [Candidatus Krumholzibacteriota bacterium]